MSELIRSAADLAPLVTFHIEVDDPDVCFIGRPARLTTRNLHLLTINPQAQWNDRTTTFRLASLTRVEFGGRYEEALVLVGGPAPV